MDPYISPTLISILTRLKDWADSQHKYLTGEEFSPTWSVLFNANITDPTVIGTSFEDPTLDSKLFTSHQQQNPYWVVMQHNLQINALAALERSFRGRHIQPVQALHAAAGRHLGQKQIIEATLGGG